MSRSRSPLLLPPTSGRTCCALRVWCSRSRSGSRSRSQSIIANIIGFLFCRFSSRLACAPISSLLAVRISDMHSAHTFHLELSVFLFIILPFCSCFFSFDFFLCFQAPLRIRLFTYFLFHFHLFCATSIDADPYVRRIQYIPQHGGERKKEREERQRKTAKHRRRVF